MSDDSDVDLLKRALRLDDYDAVNSSEESDVERDWVGGLAQRVIDPYYKERRAKGTFLYIQKANQPGRHMYLNEEVERIKWERDEAKIKAMLANGQFKVSGVLDFGGGNDVTRAHLSVQKLEPLDSSAQADMAVPAIPEAAVKKHAGKSDDDGKRHRRRDEKRERKRRSSKGRRRSSSRSRSPDKDDKKASRRNDRGSKAGKDDDKQRRHRRGSRRHDSSKDSSPSPPPRRREQKSSSRHRRRSCDASEGDSSPAQTQPSRAHRSRRHETTDGDSSPSPQPRRRERKSSSRSRHAGDVGTSAGEQRRRHNSKPSRRREVEDGERRRRTPSGDSKDAPRGERQHERLKRAEGSSRKPSRRGAEDAAGPSKSRPTRKDWRDADGKLDKKGWTELQEEKAAAPRAKHASPSAAVADDEVVKGNEAQNVYGIARNRKAAAWSSDDTDSEPEDAKQVRKAQREAERAKARAEAEAAEAKQANALEAAFEDKEGAPQVWVPPEVRTEAMDDAQDEALLKEMSAATPPTPQGGAEDEDGGKHKLKPLPVEPEDDAEDVPKAAADSKKSALPAGSPKAGSPKAGSLQAGSPKTGSPTTASPKASSPKARSHTPGSPPAEASMAQPPDAAP